jgi:hypothetical protein
MERVTGFMKPHFLLIVALAASFVGFGQRSGQPTYVRDSLESESKRLIGVVDSLMKRANHQDTIFQSIFKMVQLLSTASGRDTTELHAWRNTCSYEMARLDSTLGRLDSCTGLLNAASVKLKADLDKTTNAGH